MVRAGFLFPISGELTKSASGVDEISYNNINKVQKQKVLQSLFFCGSTTPFTHTVVHSRLLIDKENCEIGVAKTVHNNWRNQKKKMVRHRVASELKSSASEPSTDLRRYHSPLSSKDSLEAPTVTVEKFRMMEKETPLRDAAE